ncbi:hypothetical protein [Demequina aurantiaca]|uniref:hypothetical protein n=1 Tax=Demequina aurantiaca TaxID=676200 RepID=UPI003D32976C
MDLDELERQKSVVRVLERDAESDPRAYSSDLAWALSTLGFAQHSFGYPGDSLRSAEEAVAVLRAVCDLDEAKPGDRQDIILLLSNLSAAYEQAGRGERAAEAEGEAVERQRAIVVERSDLLAESRETLAGLLSGVAHGFAKSGKEDEAQRRISEARELLALAAPVFPDRVGHELIRLRNLERLLLFGEETGGDYHLASQCPGGQSVTRRE